MPFMVLSAVLLACVPGSADAQIDARGGDPNRAICPVGSAVAVVRGSWQCVAARRPADGQTLHSDIPAAPPSGPSAIARSIQSSGAPASTPLGAGASTALNAGCPEGAYPVRTNTPLQPYVCSPRGDTERTPAGGGAKYGDCGQFNTAFSSFYQGSAVAYTGQAAKNRRVEETMRSEIVQQQRLSRQLRQQAFAARHSGIRQVLSQQARSVDKDVQARQRTLNSLSTQNRGKERQFKESFRAAAKAKLQMRPEGCQVEAAGN
ncbi:MAG: hypothetical protein A2X36_10420 [Elusimicrobia bacterium GWA2_69_24]|nr:MAG: hypothetical protein A2X36_10420 [Elusimicrobia bacterium GWA2_69_24]HBL18268.1 hypothetical protein [Elusimicrobiota bacterium]